MHMIYLCILYVMQNVVHIYYTWKLFFPATYFLRSMIFCVLCHLVTFWVITSERNVNQNCFSGYVCHRVDRLSTGCCNVAVDTTRRYACDTCNSHGCCAIYEYCVSCCLQPDKVSSDSKFSQFIKKS